MRYAGLIKNDISAAPGVCLTLFTQGCPHHCGECCNPETWDYNGGREFTKDTLEDILNSLIANDIKRSFCIMGGEPLCTENLKLVQNVIKEVKNKYKNIEISIWTGYTFDELLNNNNEELEYILNNITYLIDGKYDKHLRDVTLKMRGSSNQKIWEHRNGEWKLYDK